jgi:hypothetical protein
MQLIIALYMPFVVQILWNWFAAPALHLGSISYWNMFGLLLIIIVVMIRNSTISEAHHIQRVIILLEASLPARGGPEGRRRGTRFQARLMRAVRLQTVGQGSLAIEESSVVIGQATVQAKDGFGKSYAASVLRLRWERRQKLISQASA